MAGRLDNKKSKKEKKLLNICAAALIQFCPTKLALISKPSFSSSKETLIGTKYDKTFNIP